MGSHAVATGEALRLRAHYAYALNIHCRRSVAPLFNQLLAPPAPKHNTYASVRANTELLIPATLTTHRFTYWHRSVHCAVALKLGNENWLRQPAMILYHFGKCALDNTPDCKD